MIESRSFNDFNRSEIKNDTEISEKNKPDLCR